MKQLIVLALGIVLLAAADKPPEAAPKELARLQGTWQVLAVEEDGNRLPGEKTKDWTLTIKGDKYTLRAGKKSVEGSYRLNPAANPAAIDATRTTGADKGKVLRGIYRLSDDKLVMCFNAPGKEERPKSFSTKAGGGLRMFVLTRGK